MSRNRMWLLGNLVIATASILLTVYVCAYYSMVRIWFYDMDTGDPVVFYGKLELPSWRPDPETEAWHERLTPFFAPMHRLDLSLRPDFWMNVHDPRFVVKSIE